MNHHELSTSSIASGSLLAAVDTRCDRFENSWSSGDRPRIEDFLVGLEPLSEQLVVKELLIAEWRFRVGQSESPNIVEYQDRFPQHSELVASTWKRFRVVETSGEAGPRESKRIAQFELEQKLGSGAFGVVWKARDTTLERWVALKLPRPGQLDEKGSERFIREARSAACLRDPNIVKVYEIGKHENSVFIVSEFIDGKDLGVHLEENGFEQSDAIRICSKIARALQHAHDAGVIHRDLKPQNILLDSTGEPMIADFGLARQTSGDLTVSQEGLIIGTPAYMSPEQAQGDSQKTDHRTDIYSMGVILFQLLTGQLPFRGNLHSVLHRIIHEPAPTLQSIKAAIPPPLQAICLRCLQKQPENRFQTASELASALENWPSGSTQFQLPPRKEPIIKRHWTAFLATALAAIVAAIIWLPSWFPSSVEPPQRLAVLPLDNLSPDPNDEYFAHGMREELDSKLAKLQGLTLIGRTSVLKYGSGDKDLDKIAHDLDVDKVLDGSVIKMGSEVKINLQLIDVSTKIRLWSLEFQRDLKDVFAFQNEVAQRVANELQVELQVGISTQTTTPITHDMVAYQDYLNGRFIMSRRTGTDLLRAIEQFEKATQLDPEFAEAYASLATAQALLPLYTRLPAQEHMPKALEAASRAKELKPNLTEAHAVEAWVKSFFSYDWEGAEIAFKTAISLDPNHPTPHHWYALHLCQLGEFDRALEEIQMAQKLDPISQIVNHTIGFVNYLSGNNPTAIEEFKKNIGLARSFDSRFLITEWFMGIAYHVMGDIPTAIETFQGVRAEFNQTPFYLGALGRSYAESGEIEKAETIMEELEAFEESGYSVSYDMATVLLGFGRIDEALARLEQALAERDFWIGLLKVDPVWLDQHSDPRLTKLLQEMNLSASPNSKGFTDR